MGRTVAWSGAWAVGIEPGVKTPCSTWWNPQCNLEAPRFFSQATGEFAVCLWGRNGESSFQDHKKRACVWEGVCGDVSLDIKYATRSLNMKCSTIALIMSLVTDTFLKRGGWEGSKQHRGRARQNRRCTNTSATSFFKEMWLRNLALTTFKGFHTCSACNKSLPSGLLNTRCSWD